MSTKNAGTPEGDCPLCCGHNEESFTAVISPTPKELSLAKLCEAIDFAAHAHRLQKRKNKEQSPYINHPIGVMNLLASVGGVTDRDMLAAAVLHDTVEDTDVTMAQIRAEFGDRVALFVKDATDDKALSKVERKRAQITLAPSKSAGGKMVKLADKLHNLSSLAADPPSTWTYERVQGYFVWAWFVVVGLSDTNPGLEAALDKVFVDARIPLDKPKEMSSLLEAYYAILENL